MKKIALINVFLGDIPWYFDYFVKSCSQNPTVDFYVFCDFQYKKSTPPNLELLKLTLEEFNLLSSSKLGFEISVQNAYKLCDFKPAYGVIFSEYLGNYDFWGICDIDIILGQIREFMTDRVLSDYDVISVRHDFPTGYFMLFRNEENINHLFKRSKDYVMVFQNQKHYCFDECNFKHNYLAAGYDILEVPCEIESMHHVLLKEKNNVRVFWDFLIIEGHPGQLSWDSGQLLYKNKYEVLLYHMRYFKSNLYVRKKSPKKISERFKIHGYYIQNSSMNLLKNLLNLLIYGRLNRYYSLFKQKVDYYISICSNITKESSFGEENTFSDGEIFLKKIGGKYAYLAYEENFKNCYRIIPSVIDKRTYYTKEKSLNRYTISEHSKDLIEIKKVNALGNVFNFKLRKEKDYIISS